MDNFFSGKLQKRQQAAIIYAFTISLLVPIYLLQISFSYLPTFTMIHWSYQLLLPFHMCVYLYLYVFAEKNILYTVGRISIKNGYNFNFQIECKEIHF